MFSTSLREYIFLSTFCVILQKIPCIWDNFSDEAKRKLVYSLKQVNFQPEELIYKVRKKNFPISKIYFTFPPYLYSKIARRTLFYIMSMKVQLNCLKYLKPQTLRYRDLRYYLEYFQIKINFRQNMIFIKS